MNINQALEFFLENSNTVNDFFKTGQCNYCGACILVCPKDAISYSNMEVTVNENCIHCGKCLQICSQNQKQRYMSKLVDKAENTSIEHIHPKLKDVPFGYFENLYISRGTRKDIQEHAMIGGTTLSLLLYALKTSLIDAAIITDFKHNQRFPTGKIVTSEKDLLNSGGSKYLPTMSLSSLSEVIEDTAIQSLAITTLPCQAYAIRKFGSDLKTATLNSKIKLVISLFCGSGVPSKEDLKIYFQKKGLEENFSNLEALKRRTKRFWRLNPQDQERYIYRTESGKEYDFSSRRILKTKSRENCRLLCPDYTGYFADISIGGAGISSNITVTRTELGEQLFQDALRDGYIQQNKFNFLNYFLINIMGKNQREKNRLIYEKLF